MREYRIKPDSVVDFKHHNPNDTTYFSGTKEEGRIRLDQLKEDLTVLQRCLYAERKHSLLIVLQAMDTGGKDGTIRRIFNGVSPLGVRAVGFKKPTQEEFEHDYLWRIHKHTPGRGKIVIFNRSHYEDIVAVRVNNLAPRSVWSRRYDHINHFEQMLTDEGITILKFFIHIDREEQKKRLQARLDNPDKNWKFNPGDLDARALWPKYMRAYEDVISQTSTKWAPWYIIPANRKWYRDIVVSAIIVDVLKGLRMSYPKPKFDPAEIIVK